MPLALRPVTQNPLADSGIGGINVCLNNVRRCRKARGMSQAELAAMEVDRAYISGLERGERNITILSLWPEVSR